MGMRSSDAMTFTAETHVVRTPDGGAMFLDISGHESHACGGDCAWHHTDEKPTASDIAVADFIAGHIGTTGIADIPDTRRSSVVEWSEIVKALRLHGLEIRNIAPVDGTLRGRANRPIEGLSDGSMKRYKGAAR